MCMIFLKLSEPRPWENTSRPKWVDFKGWVLGSGLGEYMTINVVDAEPFGGWASPDAVIFSASFEIA